MDSGSSVCRSGNNCKEHPMDGDRRHARDRRTTLQMEVSSRTKVKRL